MLPYEDANVNLCCDAHDPSGCKCEFLFPDANVFYRCKFLLDDANALWKDANANLYCDACALSGCKCEFLFPDANVLCKDANTCMCNNQIFFFIVKTAFRNFKPKFLDTQLIFLGLSSFYILAPNTNWLILILKSLKIGDHH